MGRFYRDDSTAPRRVPAAGKARRAGGINVEGLAWDPKSNRLLLGVRSPVVDVTWNGAGREVREVQKFLPGEKPEGVTGATLGGRTATIVLFDTSHFAILP